MRSDRGWEYLIYSKEMQQRCIIEWYSSRFLKLWRWQQTHSCHRHISTLLFYSILLWNFQHLQCCYYQVMWTSGKWEKYIFSRKGLPKVRLPSNSLWSWEWPWTSAPPCLHLLSAGIPPLCHQSQSSIHARQAPYQQSCPTILPDYFIGTTTTGL